MSDVTFLIPDLRAYLGDVTEEYTFSDTLLETSLFTAIKMLGRRLRYRYLLDQDYTITRSTTGDFKAASPPVIEYPDQAAFVVQAAIIIKTGSAWDSSWDIASWKDDELAYSNIQGARSRDSSIERDLQLLEELIKGRLFAGKAYELPGFHLSYNTEEGTL